MKIRDYVLLAYDAFGGKISGKTLLQKKLYFLSIMLNQGFGYRPHYYGPYSGEVAEANNDLKSLGFLSELSSCWGISSRGFENARYDYSLTDDGKYLVDQKKENFHDEWKKIEEASKVIEKTIREDSLDYMELSIAAKAYFLLGNNEGKATFENIKTMARNFGWSVGDDELDKAANFLEKIGLVTRT